MKAEPAVVGSAVAAILGLVTLLAFGHELTVEQEAAIVSVVTVLCGLWVRSRVTPTG